METNDNISRPIDELDVSTEFKERAKKLGIRTLGDVLNSDIRDYKAHSEFDPFWYIQLLALLKKENVLEDFQRRLF